MEGPHSPAGPGAQPSDRDTIVNPVTFMSYNMTGADTVKCQWVRDVGAEHNVHCVALQEHFKTVKIPAYGAPGIDSGRGRGGLVQLTEKSLTVTKSCVSSKSPRVQAQLLTFPTCKIIWINCYMPCDPQTQHFDDTELIETLSEVERMITSNGDCEVVVSADMNYDTRRDNHFTRTVAPVLLRLGLSSVWEGW